MYLSLVTRTLYAFGSVVMYDNARPYNTINYTNMGIEMGHYENRTL